MAKGGYRNRAGRPPVEDSERSERRGYKLSELPPEGYQGEIPDFPLPNPSPRELQVWQEAWRTPQACAWSLESERWRIPTVAMWVRVKVRCENPDAGAALYAQLHRFADQIGMTTAGLREMGWKVARPTEVEDADVTPIVPSARTRLRIASSDG